MSGNYTTKTTNLAYPESFGWIHFPVIYSERKELQINFTKNIKAEMSKHYP